MVVLDRAGQLTTDTWIRPDDASASTGPKIIRRDDLEALMGSPPAGKVGIWLSPWEELEPVLRHLSRINLIAVEFPKFRDGRGFTTARMLRRHGFRNELRAVGHVLPDQAPALVGCGFDTIAVPAGQPLERWREFLQRDGSSAPPPLLRRLASASNRG